MQTKNDTPNPGAPAKQNGGSQEPEQPTTAQNMRPKRRPYVRTTVTSATANLSALSLPDMFGYKAKKQLTGYFWSFFLNMSRSRALCLAALAPDNAPSLASSFMTSPRLPCRRAIPSVKTTPTASGTHIGGRSLVTSSPTCHVGRPFTRKSQQRKRFD